jgi:hypothetical protein
MKKILRPDHENVGTPTKTHGAKHRRSPTGTHLNKKTLSRSDSAPRSAHNAKNPIANLGDYAHKAKLPTGKKIGGKNAAKSVANKIRKTAKDRVYS